MTSAAARSAALKKALVEAVAEIADEPTRLHITAKYRRGNGGGVGK